MANLSMLTPPFYDKKTLVFANEKILYLLQAFSDEQIALATKVLNSNSK
jgi:hypothetical protein